MGIPVLEWPPWSPDLNPIENLWALLKVRLNKEFPNIEEEGMSWEAKARFYKRFQGVWKSLGQEEINRYILPMKRRIAAVIKAEGWYTKY